MAACAIRLGGSKREPALGPFFCLVFGETFGAFRDMSSDFTVILGTEERGASYITVLLGESITRQSSLLLLCFLADYRTIYRSAKVSRWHVAQNGNIQPKTIAYLYI